MTITRIKEILKKPVAWILLFNAVLYLTGILWGLPSSEDWHSDSLAPYYPLLGLSQGFSFGYLNKYPLVHQVLLAVLNLPVALAAFINSSPAEGLSLSKFLLLIRSPEYASWLTLTDRLVSAAMGLGIIYWMYRAVRELFTERAGLIAAFLLSFDAVLNFYSHMAKVEVPYVFWGVLGMYMLIKVIKYRNLSDYMYLALFSCLCYGTKDQGYAVFFFPFIFYLLVWPALFPEQGVSRLKSVFNRKFLIFCGAFILFSVITQNIIFNLDGFLYRFSILTGWNGQRSIAYTMDFAGIFALFADSARCTVREGIGLPLFLLYTAGAFVFICLNFRRGKTFLLQLVFLLGSVSVYLTFVQVVRQAQVRYLLPVTVFMTAYGAWLVDYAWEKVRGRMKIFCSAVMACVLLYSFWFVFSSDMNLINDLRYRAEEWMEENIPEGSSIEYYAYLHYLPRFPKGTYSYRVTKDAMSVEKRRPDYIAVTSHYYNRFFAGTDDSAEGGRIKNTQKAIRFMTESDMPQFMKELFSDGLNYRVAAEFNEEPHWYRKVGHARLSPARLVIYKRTDPEKTGKKAEAVK